MSKGADGNAGAPFLCNKLDGILDCFVRRCGSAEDGPEFEPLKAGEGWPFHVDHYS